MMMRGPAMPWEEKDDAVSERAADFLANRRFGGWSEADQAALDAWLAESALHRVAWLRVEAIAACTDELAAVHTFGPCASSDHAAPRSDGKSRFRMLALPLLAAASIALLLAGGFPLVAYLRPPPADHSYSTDIGNQTLLKFADGTQIELNTDTAVRYRMTTAERTVWLEKGEAWFHVAHNPADPFTVIVGKHRVTDLGTEFLVRRGAGRMEVALFKGRASLGTEGAQTAATLKPGDEAVATPVSLSVTRKTQQELADELSWRRGVLVFRNTRLADVVREFNRYNATKLVIADPSIADLRFSAELKTDDFAAFLNLAEMRLSLRTDREGNDILISRVAGKAKRRGHIGRSSSEAVARVRSSSEAVAQ